MSKMNAYFMDKQEAIGDSFEQWSADGATVSKMEMVHGQDVADAYAEWIYFNEK